MAAKAENVVRIASAPDEDGTVKSIFFCASKEAAAAVDTDGYFNAKRAQLSVGDVIIVSGATDILLHRVDTVPASGNVTTSVETGAAGA
jgi:hypothetical protein